MLINGFFASSAGGSADALPLCWWQGWSGRWLVTSIMSLDRRSCDAPGLFLVSGPNASGARTPLAIGVAPDIEAALAGPFAGQLAELVLAGASEVHVNLVGAGPIEYETAAADIARAWNVPLWRAGDHPNIEASQVRPAPRSRRKSERL